MTDEPKPEPEDELRDQAKTSIEAAPGIVPDAEGLPDDVPSEPIEDEQGT